MAEIQLCHIHSHSVEFRIVSEIFDVGVVVVEVKVDSAPPQVMVRAAQERLKVVLQEIGAQLDRGSVDWRQ